MTLQLADGSIKHPKGIVEDLLVQVDKCKVPMDFVVLEVNGVLLKHKDHMIVLGRPFMATTKINLDSQSGKLTMIVVKLSSLKQCIQFHILLLLLLINVLMWIL